jgi:hypothetical protein
MRAYAKRKGWQVGLKIEEIGSGAVSRPRREELRRASIEGLPDDMHVTVHVCQGNYAVGPDYDGQIGAEPLIVMVSKPYTADELTTALRAVGMIPRAPRPSNSN